MCLVHRHCDLEDDEIMVAEGNVTQPERIHRNSHTGLVDGLVVVALRTGGKRIAYPGSWDISGQPFEYTLDLTPPLPSQLLERFKETVEPAAIAEGVLGICHIPEADSGALFVEHTEGRKNILEIPAAETKIPADSSISTNWSMSAGTPQMYCTYTGPGHGTTSCIAMDTSHGIPPTSVARPPGPAVVTESANCSPPNEVKPLVFESLRTRFGPDIAQTVTTITVLEESEFSLPDPDLSTVSFQATTTTKTGIERVTMTTTVRTRQNPGTTGHIILTTTTTTETTRTTDACIDEMTAQSLNASGLGEDG